MDLYNRLPDDLRNKMFIFYKHPNSQTIIHYKTSLAQLYEKCSHMKQHDGDFGWSTLLNHLWIISFHNNNNNYYKIWERLYIPKSEKIIKTWLGKVGRQPHKVQIAMIWALFTDEERNHFLLRRH